MKYFLRNSLLLLLILLPSFADIGDGFGGGGGGTDAQTTFLAGITDQVGKVIGTIFGPTMLALNEGVTNLNERWDWSVSFWRLVGTLILIIGLQFLIIKLWVIVIKVLIKMFMIYKILIAPKSEIGDLLELVSKGKTDISNSVRSKIESGKGSIGTIAKLFTLLS